MSYPDLVQPLLDRRDMTFEEAQALMRYFVSGEANDAQIGGALLALRVKGATSSELAGFASVLRESASSIDHDLPNIVDTCGTGGGSPSFNISTASAVVACAAGVRLAKHGNRAVTSKCGSADILEALGVKIGGEHDDLRKILEEVGIVFLFAPQHHPGMRHVGQARRDLGVRTVFNQIGPLANPARARRQLVGVYEASLLMPMGEALNELGTERAILAHGRDGLDEISPCVATDVVRVWEGEVTRLVWTPQHFGIEPLPASAISPGDTLEENAAIFREAITDPESPRFLAILPSTAVTIYIAGIANTLFESAERAREIVAEGKALAKLEEMAGAGTPR
ncbi:MAG TPA: anthranilate phosphoribosyltransferase [Fimbriimonas sp.]